MNENEFPVGCRVMHTRDGATGDVVSVTGGWVECDWADGAARSAVMASLLTRIDTPPPAPSAPHMVPSLVPAPEGAVLARWEDVRVGDEYASLMGDQMRTRKLSANAYLDATPNPLVWCWPAAAKPVTVEVDVELLRRIRNCVTWTDDDASVLDALIEAAEADSEG